MTSKAILMAVRPQEMHLVHDALGAEFDLVVCHTLVEAAANLNEKIGLIACGVHFDQGAMFDLLRAAKANPATRSVPFFLLLAEGTAYSKAVLDGIRSASKLLGAAGFTDLSRLKSDVGDQQANEQLRQAIRKALSGPQ